MIEGRRVVVSARIGVEGGDIDIAEGDITRFEGDAIVNAANSGLLGGGGVDGAIHRAAGPILYEECRAIVERQGPLPAGRAVITSAGALSVRYVIHAVGPVWRGGTAGEAETLASAYRESLALAAPHSIRTIAFPSISTGAYGYPIRQAADVALDAVKEELASRAARGLPPVDVTFVLFDRHTLSAYSEALERLQDSPESRDY